MTITWHAALLIAAITADALTTLIAVKAGGVEINPLLDRLMQKFGPLPTIALTHGGMLVLVACLGHHAHPLGNVFVAVLFGAVAINNLRVVARLKGWLQ